MTLDGANKFWIDVARPKLTYPNAAGTPSAVPRRSVIQASAVRMNRGAERGHPWVTHASALKSAVALGEPETKMAFLSKVAAMMRWAPCGIPAISAVSSPAGRDNDGNAALVSRHSRMGSCTATSSTAECLKDLIRACVELRHMLSCISALHNTSMVVAGAGGQRSGEGSCRRRCNHLRILIFQT